MDEPVKTRVCVLLVMKLLRCHRVLGRKPVHMFSHFWRDQQLLILIPPSTPREANNVESAVHDKMPRCLMSLSNGQAREVWPRRLGHDACVGNLQSHFVMKGVRIQLLTILMYLFSTQQTFRVCNDKDRR